MAPPVQGWTLANNLQNTKEIDPAMVPEGQISIEGLSGLDRTMAEIFSTRGVYIMEQARGYTVKEADVGAVLQVESNGKAFGITGQPITRFEVHIFWSRWGRDNADQFNQHFQFDREDKSWTDHRWRPDPQGAWQSLHGSQERELEVLEFARSLTDSGALLSASYGAGQVMGFNHGLLGFQNPQEMHEAFVGTMKAQLDGMFSYFENTSALAAPKRGDYVGLAAAYSGGGQADHYSGLIQNASVAYDRVRSQA
jgi:hypothetical protein